MSLIPPGSYAWDYPSELVFPVATLVTVTVPYLYRMMRASMIEALESDYVEAARLKGMPSWRIALVHTFPNAIAPTIQVIGLNYLYLAGGIVVVEYVFDFPGIGTGLVNAVSNRDIPTVQVIVIILAAFYIVVNILTDVVSLLATPRRRLPRYAMALVKAAAATQGLVAIPDLRGRQWLTNVGRAVRTPRGMIGVTLTTLVVGVAAVGPFVAPYDPDAFVTPTTFSHPSGKFLLGGDVLARDVLSRVLNGGWVLLLMAVAAMAFGVILGATAGISAAYLGGRIDSAIMRTVDVLLSFPQIVFALLIVSIIGPKLWVIVIAVGLGHLPQVARVIRAASLDLAERDFVKAIELEGVSPFKVMTGELLPSLVTPLMVEAGLRLTYSIIIMSGLSFLGFGQPPPAANWGLMINENRIGLSSNLWATAVPAALIAILTIGTNTFTDAIARVSIGIEGRPVDLASVDGTVAEESVR